MSRGSSAEPDLIRSVSRRSSSRVASSENYTFVFTLEDLTEDVVQKHRSVDGLRGLTPGDILIYDCAPPSSEPLDKSESVQTSSLKFVEWNIERGYKLDGVIRELRDAPALRDFDIAAIQELDISCKRSEFANVPLEIALSLKCTVAFVVEFHELPSPFVTGTSHVITRDPSTESGCAHGFHGNAILVSGNIIDGTRRAVLRGVRAFTHSSGMDWEGSEGVRRREPRRGARCVLTASVDTINDEHFTRVQVYSLHLEVFGGPLMRARQFSDCLRDAQEQRRRFFAESTASPTRTGRGSRDTARFPSFDPSEITALSSYAVTATYPTRRTSARVFVAPPPHPPTTAGPLKLHFAVFIGGDMNTLMGGVTRLSLGGYSGDRMRYLSLGETEAEWWQRQFFETSPSIRRGEIAPIIGAITAFPSVLANALYEALTFWRYFKRSHTGPRPADDDVRHPLTPAQYVRRLYMRTVLGLSEAECSALDNRELQLHDPFDKKRDVTMLHPNYFGLVYGKLDWVLLSNLYVVDKGHGNDKYNLSDHKYLWVRAAIFPFTEEDSNAQNVSHSSGEVKTTYLSWQDNDSALFARRADKDRRSLFTTLQCIAWQVLAGLAVCYAVPPSVHWIKSTLKQALKKE